jgi:hypothetical protein
LKTSTVPFLMWTSDKGGLTVPRVSISFLAPIILEQLGRGLPPYLRFVQQLSRQMPVLQRRFQVMANGEILSRMPDTSSGPLGDYWLLQYDLLLGHSFGATLMFD